MKTSIITVSYNSAQTIEESIQSVFSQTFFPNVEYILIDGGSNDGTWDIIKKYKSKFAVCISEKDNGIYDAMNKGIKVATGDVIGILNSDDLYADENVLKDVMSSFEMDKDLAVLYGDIVYVKRFQVYKVVRRWTSKPYCSSFFENANVPPHPALFVKSSVYKEAGVFDLSYLLAADYEFMLRVFKKHRFKIKYINRLMIFMRLGGETNKSIKNILNGNKEILRAWKANDLKAPVWLMPLRMIKRILQFF